MNKVFDYSLEPGKDLDIVEYEDSELVISIIVPFYNDKLYIEQCTNSLLNQTFPYFEILIIDDGSTDKESLQVLENISKKDKRIKVLHKSNEGLAATRDYGAKMSSSSTKYFFFIDSDDLVDKTFLECAYFTLETNKEAAWAYSDSVGFECKEYTWNKWFDSNKLKKVNELISCSLIRKENYFEVGGYGLREKAVNEDWNFWLKLIAKERFPVHMSFYGLWYRRKNNGELKKSKENKKRSLEIIKKTAKTIKKNVEAIQYPRFAYNNDALIEYVDDVCVPIKKESSKKSILMFIPWMVTGGADVFNFELVKRLNKYYNFIIVSSVPNTNPLRQKMEDYAIIYDLTSFLDRKYWLSFINYLIKKENIKLFFCTNSMFGYSLMPYLKNKYSDIPILDYVHMEEWYYRDGGYARMSSNYKEYIDKTIVCNKRTERVLLKDFGKNKDSISTIYIGVDDSKFNPTLKEKNLCLEKYSLPKDKFIISYICRIAEQKRPFLLFEIMKRVLSKRADVFFVIAGDGEMLEPLKNKVLVENMQDFVKFLGNITDTYDIYRVSDITINCSIKEGLALTSYESLSMGVPVITADVGGQSELIDSFTGRVVPCLQEEVDIKNFSYSDEEIQSYVKAIDEVIVDLDVLKENCRAKIEKKFTLEQMALNMKGEFDKLIEGKIKNSPMEIEQSLNFIQEEFNYDIDSSIYLVQEYQREVYGFIHTDKNGKNISSYRKELIKEKLWQSLLWRKFVNSKFWKFIKKLVK